MAVCPTPSDDDCFEDKIKNLCKYPDVKNPKARVTINISGHIYVVYRETLDRIPGHRLYKLTKDDPSYDNEKDEYFFEANPALFPYILDYFKQGTVHFPKSFCTFTLRTALEFWKIEDSSIPVCCWKDYTKSSLEVKDYFRISSVLNWTGTLYRELDKNATKWAHFKRKVCIFLNDPASGLGSKMWTLFFLANLLASMFVIIVEMDENFRVPITWEAEVPFNFTNPRIAKIYNTNIHPGLTIIEAWTTIFFTLEFLLQIIVTRCPIYFLKQPGTYIDLVSIVGSFIALFFIMHCEIRNYVSENIFIYIAGLVNFARFLRVYRFVRLANYYRSFRLLIASLYCSKTEILLLCFLLMIGMVVFSVFIFWAEFFAQDGFPSVSVGCWWAIVTMTTVGYGDLHPASVGGYIVGTLTAVIGLICTGLPIPIIGNTFSEMFQAAKFEEQWKTNLKNREKKELTKAELESAAKKCCKILDDEKVSSSKDTCSLPEVHI